MTEQDNEVRDQLVQENGGGEYDLGREETLREMVVESFRGKTWWMAMVAWVYSILFTGVAVFAAIRFFGAEAGAVREMIAYAMLFGLSSAIVLFVKLWYWMLMSRNSVKREVKRLELRIAELAEAIRQR